MSRSKINIILLVLVSLFFSTSSWDNSSMLVAQNPVQEQQTEVKKKTAKKKTAPKKNAKKKIDNKNVVNNEVENTAIREEIQRYIGYEPLFYRYLTLPYDLTVNSNVQGPFIEIGYLLLIFLPILLLIGFKKKKYLSVLTMFIVLVLGIISFSNNPLKPTLADSSANGISTYLNTKANAPTFLESMIGNIYIGAKQVPGINSLTANTDYFSYFVIIGMFVFLFFLIHERINSKSLTRRFITMYLMFYAFLFLIMTAGIVWYGYLFFAIATLFMFKEIYEYKKSNDIVKKYVFYLCGATSMIWILMAFTFRVSNHNKSKLNNKNSHLMYETSMVQYQSGKNTKDDLKEIFFKNSVAAFDEINSDLDAQIIKVGTPFNFFIKKSDSRVLEDNQLNRMTRFISEMPNKESLASALKAAGYKYLIVDLNTHTLDRTPEKTLVKKFEGLLKFIFQNPNVELISTDRLLKTPLPEDHTKIKVDYGVYGDIHFPGTYAIYRFK